jgi:AraC family transcriptional regulator of adaptative response / DNA-3-methyladenine glycosylase II
VIGGRRRHDGVVVLPLDPERCYRAAASRDARFDGWFYIAVRTTGIYCRPSCPAVTPKRHNVEFHPSAAAAQQRGFRACKRCRPDASPGSPEWDVRADVVARAMRLIADGTVDREGVAGLAGRLGYSVRHLGRLLDTELGAGPLALARSQRAQTARVLIETTTMSMTDVAFAAGFGSIRQFNDTVRAVYGVSPTELRGASRGALPAVDGSGVTVRLATRAPFGGQELLEFLGARAIPGVETFDGSVFRRTLGLPRGHGVVSIDLDGDAVRAAFRLEDWRDLAPGVQRVRRLLDLDADPVAVDAVLGADRHLAPLVRASAGRRVPGSVDAAETALRAVVGQQISVAGAPPTPAGRAAAGAPRLRLPDDDLAYVVPSPTAWQAVDPAALPMPATRRRTVATLAARLASGELVLDPGADRADARRSLLAVPGVGPWTADYIVMRGLGDPDVFLPTDLGVRHAMARAGIPDDAPDAWSPWRSYALHHLWATL